MCKDFVYVALSCKSIVTDAIVEKYYSKSATIYLFYVKVSKVGTVN